MSEENSNKTKRDLMWEQKKRLREEKIKSTYTSSQDYTKQEQNNEPVFSNPQINSNENIRSSENIPQFSGEIKPKVFNEPKNLNFNAFNHFSNDNGKQPASQPSNERVPFHNEPNANFVMKSNNEPFQNNGKNNSNFGNFQQSKNMEINEPIQKSSNRNENNFPNNQNNYQSMSPNVQKDDPNVLNNLMKKEYGEFLKNQMREKENKKGNATGQTGQNKVEQLQASMENKAYNPFGRPGGGGPNKKMAVPNPNPINYNNNGNLRGIKKQDIDENEQNYFQPNEYNALMQNNFQNLQKEKVIMQNYKNFMNQNNQNNSFDRNNQYIPPTSSQQNYQYVPPVSSNQNYQIQQDYNNNYPPQQQPVYNQNQYNNNNFQQPYENPNNNQQFEGNNVTANPQTYQNHQNDNKNFNSLNNDNKNGNNGIPSMKVRTGRNRLMYENMGENELVKKEAKAQEMQKALMEQIELKKRQKEMEKEKIRMEEAVEEARLQKEREQIEYELKMEEEKKKAKFEKVRQDNLDLKEEKVIKKGNIFNNNTEDVSKDISKDLAENVVKKPLMLRTDVSKEFLEQEGKKSRRNVRNRPAIPNQNLENFFGNNNNNNENFMNSIHTPNQNQDMNILNYNDERGGNRNNEVMDLQMRREMEIQNIKNDARSQQKNMQQKLLEIQNEASTAIKQKNQAEQELLNLRQVLKEKVMEEEKYKRNLLQALTKNDPNTKRRTSNQFLNTKPLENNPPTFNLHDMNMNMNYNTSNIGGDYNDIKRRFTDSMTPKLPSNNELKDAKQNFIKPLKIYERGGVTSGRDVFQEANMGDKTLISDTKMIPMDILDQYAKQHDNNNPLTLSKIGHLAMRPNSSNMYEGSNRYEKILNRQDTDSPNQSDKHFMIKKRPYSQKNQRYENDGKFNMEHSINSEITKEIDTILKTHQMELTNNNNNNNKINTFNQAAHGVLETGKYPTYNEGVGIKLDSEFPTLKDQSLYSMKSYGVKKGEQNDHLDEIERILKSKGKQEKNHRYEDSYKEQTLHSTINIDDLNKRNDERLKEIDMMERYMEGGDKNNFNNQRNNLNVIDEEDEIAKLDKLIKNL